MRRLLVVAVALVVLSELLAGIGIGAGSHAAVIAFALHGHRGLSSSLLAAAVIYGLRAERANRNAALFLGLALEVGHAFLLRDPGLALMNLGGGFGIAALIVAAIERKRLIETAVFPVFALAAVLPLELTVLLHPHTVDARFLAMETRMFGGAPSFSVGRLFADHDLVRLVGSLTLHSVPAVGAFVWITEQRAVERREISRGPDLLLSLFTANFAALVFHHALPAAGPGSYWPIYPYEVPSLARALEDLGVAGTRERIGVPCLPVVWSLLIYWHARVLGPRLRIVGAIGVALTLLATLGLGEHYLVDIVITLPFAVALRRHRSLAVALFAVWLIVARTSLVENAWALRLLAAITVVGSFLLEHRFQPTKGGEESTDAPAPLDRRAGIIAAIFFASGFAGLLYEVVFAKELALVFGSTAVASTTVLATYMGGMALGAAVGGRLQVKSALRMYGFCELGIAVSCALSPVIVGLVRSAYVALASGGDPGRPSVVALQVALGALVLLPPTLLMGMTLPILARYFEREDPTLGRSVALLYSANTAGAATGALLAGYYLLPSLGVLGAIVVGVLANAAIALGVLRLSSRASSAPEEVKEVCLESVAVSETAAVRWLGLVALGIGGVVSLGLEITYNHLLAVVVGNSTYAFSSMLVSFLVGLAVGASVGRRCLRRRLALPTGIGIAQAGLAVVVLLGVFAWNGVPAYFEGYAHFTIARTFAITELIRFVVCACLLIPPAFFVGMSYPISIEAVVRGSKVRERALGNGAALNTFGNITGALITGFVLIPTLGSLRTLHALMAVTVLIAASALALSRDRALVVALGAAAAVFVFQPSSFDLDRLASGANVYFKSVPRGAVIASAESLEGGLTTVCRESAGGEAIQTLMTNGKFQGNDSPTGEMRAQYGFTLMPLLHTTTRGTALIIGLGTGTSARAIAEAGYSEVHVAELSRDIVTMSQRYFARINANVVERSNVHVSHTDGRNFLLLQHSKYDFIGVEITSIWFAGAASLYNVDFYELTKRRLSEHGVFQQWIQLHHIDTTDIVSILASIRVVFERVWLYVAGGQGVIVACATDCPPTDEAATKLDRTPALADGIALLGGSTSALVANRILTPKSTDRLLEAIGAPPSDRERLMAVASTDDNSFLEYHTPRGNIQGDASYEKNLAFLRRFAALP